MIAQSAKQTMGEFVCPNHQCISVKKYRAVQSRDETSALAIVVADLSYMLFNEPLPMFNPYTSQSNTNFFPRPRLSVQEPEMGATAMLFYRLNESGKYKLTYY